MAGADSSLIPEALNDNSSCGGRSGASCCQLHPASNPPSACRLPACSFRRCRLRCPLPQRSIATGRSLPLVPGPLLWKPAGCCLHQPLLLQQPKGFGRRLAGDNFWPRLWQLRRLQIVSRLLNSCPPFWEIRPEGQCRECPRLQACLGMNACLAVKVLHWISWGLFSSKNDYDLACIAATVYGVSPVFC